MREISKIQNLKLKQGSWWKVATITLAIFVLIVGGILAYRVVAAIRNIIIQNLSGSAPALLGQIYPGKLKGEGDGRINILVLGIPGNGYLGPYLSDTNIVVSIDPRTKHVAMLSLPRDLYVEVPNFGYNKLNMAHSLGETNQIEGGGPALSKQVISNILDLPIHYFVRVDFSGFKKIVDLLGGVEVEVKKDIVDWSFPDDQGGTVFFQLKAGTYNMDGELALKYARSRYTTSDFDRASRQQQILVAIKNKALKMENLLNPNKISELTSILSKHVRTDLQIWEIERLIDFARQIDSGKVVSKVLDDSSDGLLYGDYVGDMFVLKPRSGDFREVAAFAHQIFIDSYIRDENARIIIENGTLRGGIATELSKFLKDYGYNIVAVKMASRTNYSETLIYDYTGGKKPYTISYLQKRLNAKVQKASGVHDFDIKIILGSNYTKPTVY